MQIPWLMTAPFNRVLFSILILSGSYLLRAQPRDTLTGLPSIPNSTIEENRIKKASTVLTLPFFDDFSKDNPQPNSELWLDRQVYISQTMPAQPPTLGAAVFDGLDEYGLAYELGRLSTDSTDVLTSNYIDLSSPVDSVYLSFYWQPAGNGEPPESNDSLQLEFYNDSTNKWQYAWSALGDDSGSFELEMVPVPIGYFRDSFQFRFRSFGAPAGAYDTWLLDYVRLDDGRDRYDTLPLLKDPAFTRPHPSLLQGYESLPFFHYDNTVAGALNRQILTLHYQENPNTPPPYSPDPIPLNLGIYEIREGGNILASDPNGNDQLDNGLGFFVEERFSILPNSFVPPGLPRSSEFSLNAYQTYDGTALLFGPNDTIEREQVFSNYYAHDDGTAERAYHVSDNAEGIMVTRYVIQSLADSLKGLYIYFFPAEYDITVNEFKLVVFEENSQGRPGNLIYESDSNYIPAYSGTNFYLPYSFDKAVRLNQTNIYVGIRQIKNTRLPIGFDRNTRGRSTIFYGKVGGSELFQSFQKGTLMVRPYLRYDPADLNLEKHIAGSVDINLYPNPATHSLHFAFDPVENAFRFTLYDLKGQAIWNGDVKPEISIPAYVKPGIYVLRIEDTNGILLAKTIKLIINP